VEHQIYVKIDLITIFAIRMLAPCARLTNIYTAHGNNRKTIGNGNINSILWRVSCKNIPIMKYGRLQITHNEHP